MTGRRAHPLVWRAAAASVLVLAAVLRLWRLGSPNFLVFDEKYYVRYAGSLLRYGFETQWTSPDDGSADPAVLTGAPVLQQHPPLGKWLVALGMRLFGVDDPVGWRVVVALLGVVLVALTMLVALQLFRSWSVAVLAGGLLAIDGNAIVMSRTAMLDTPAATFSLAAVALLLAALPELLGRAPRRPRTEALLLLGSGVAVGAAAAVKWSTVPVSALLLALAVFVVARRGRPRRRGVLAVVGAVLVSLAVYLLSWASWFVSPGAIDRGFGPLSLAALPGLLLRWSRVQLAMAVAGAGYQRPVADSSGAAEWVLPGHPPMFTGTLDAHGASALVLDVPNPLIWWGAVLVLVLAIWRSIRVRRAEWLVPIGLVLVAWLPWLLVPGRTTFQYYTLLFEPLMLVLLAATLFGARPGVGPATDAPGLLRPIRVVFVVAAVLVSAFFFPLWTNIMMPTWFINAHAWLPGWL